jgi:hypothetical protein
MLELGRGRGVGDGSNPSTTLMFGLLFAALVGEDDARKDKLPLKYKRKFSTGHRMLPNFSTTHWKTHLAV